MVGSWLTCYRTAYSFAADNWMNASAILKQFPITADDLKALSVPGLGRFAEYKDTRDVYFISVRSVKHTGEPSPLEFIRSQIKEVIVNKKKVILIQKIYDGIYQDALRNGKCEVLAKK